MSDETIAVTIQETTLPVSIDTGTPQISIIEQSGDVTIIEANPIQVTAIEGDVTVVINSGVYGSADPINVEDLVGYITRLQLDPDLTTDLEHLDAMWTQIGGKTVLLGSDGIAIRLAGQAYTDNSILTAITDINADVDSKISNSTAANSLITDALDDRITSVNMDLSLDIGETNTAIENLDLRVTSIQQDTLEDLGIMNTSLDALGQTVTNNKAEIDGRLSALDLFVGTTDTSIYSVVSRLDAIDGATGNIVDLESSIAQTADSINLRVTSLETSIDGRITSAESRISVTENYIESAVLKFSEIDGTTTDLSSYIQQTANSIDSRITSVETSIDGRFDTAESRIYQTEQGILSTVTSLSGITGENGSLSLLQSSIDQQAASIVLEVLARQELNGNLIETSSNLSLLTDSVALMATEYNEVEGRVTSAELILGVDGINISLIESTLGLQSYTIGTIQNILTNQWTVSVSEDVAGNVYTTGFGLVLHPIWLVDEYYTTGFIVTADTAVYECILSHTSSAANSPLIAGGASYWSLLPNGVKSEFNIQADAFRIMTSSGPVPVFEVTDDVITLRADVAIAGTLTISYGDVVDAPTTLSGLDPAASAILIAAAANAAQAIQDAAAAQETADGKITSFYQTSAPISGYDVGDFWIDTDGGNKLYRRDTISWVPVQDNAIQTALNNAQTAQTTADGKAEVFYSSTTPAGMSVGDLWYNTTTKLLQRYTGSAWQYVASYGATWGTNITNQPDSLADINATEYGKLPTAALGALAYLNTVGNSQVTTISGGKIATGVIYGNNSYSYWDLTNNKMYFTSYAQIQFASSAKLVQADGGASVEFYDDELWLEGPTGQYLQLNENYVVLYTDDYVIINAGSAQKIYFKFGTNSTIQTNIYGIRPVNTYDSSSLRQLLGDSGYEWSACYAHTFYDDGGGFLDLQDDLAVMAEFKPRKEVKIDQETGEKTISGETEINPKSGFEYLDILSIPRWMTNYDEVFKKLKEENGDLLSEEDIDELIQDREEAGWLLNRNLGAFNDLTSGAVRQMDIENKEMYELIFSRLTALEKENKELKERVTVLEGEKIK